MKKRITLDSQGKPLIEIRDRDGLYEEDVNRSAIRRYKADELNIAATGAWSTRVPGSNPYEGGCVATGKPLKRRSSLDYLRELSAQIKKQRDGEK